MSERVKSAELSGQIDYLRQKDWFDPTKEEAELTIIGAGGIGSMFTVLASKLGISDIVLYDDDSFEAHNIPNQFASKAQLGMPKVEAIKETAEDFGIAEITPIEGRVTPYTNFNTKYIVSGVDSMEARVDIFEAIEESVGNSEREFGRYWDARLGGEMVTIYSVDLTSPEEMEAYKTTLYSDSEAVDLPCTRRAVIDVMGYVSSYLVSGVRKAISGEETYGYLFFNAEDMFLETSDLLSYVEFNNSTLETAEATVTA